MLNLDIESIDYSNQIYLKNNYDIPSFVYIYLEEIKNQIILKIIDNNSNNLLFMCEILINYSWDMLNTNLWCFVESMWRHVYGYAMLYKILILDYKYEHESLIKLCDLG
jgi:hypothetical protein